MTNYPLPAQTNLVCMICDDKEYKILGKMGMFLKKTGEEDKLIKILQPVASQSVEGVNFITKVFCVPGVFKWVEVRAGMPKFYISKKVIY